jgi:hypothetical protein
MTYINMTLKDYIDNCTWDELKTAQGVKEYMQRSLADLKRLEPKYTEETAEYTIHFSENDKDEDDYSEEEFVQYDAFVRKADYEGNIGVFECAWDEMLPLEVIIDNEQTLSDNEIVAAVIWELTWKGSTSEECEKAWIEWWKEREKLTEDDFIPWNVDVLDIKPDEGEKDL